MGVSTDAIICYGISYEEGYKFPWDHKNSIEEWWVDDVLGFTPSIQIYDSEGNHLPKVTEEQINQYWKERRDFEDKCPLPVELIRHCSWGYPMFIVAVPSTVIYAHRGYPKELNPKHFDLSNHNIQSFIDFCKKHNIYEEDPKWWLCSFWEN